MNAFFCSNTNPLIQLLLTVSGPSNSLLLWLSLMLFCYTQILLVLIFYCMTSVASCVQSTFTLFLTFFTHIPGQNLIFCCILCFFIFFEHQFQNFISAGETGPWAVFPMQLYHFLNIALFPETLNVKLFGKLYLTFLILNINVHFTCGEWKLY